MNLILYPITYGLMIFGIAYAIHDNWPFRWWQWPIAALVALWIGYWSYLDLRRTFAPTAVHFIHKWETCINTPPYSRKLIAFCILHEVGLK